MTPLTTHRCEGDTLNNGLAIGVIDNPGPGGGHSEYQISIADAVPNIHQPRERARFSRTLTNLRFQNMPVQDAGGINGISNEALLAIVEHRLSCFQQGDYKCAENEAALAGIRSALEAMRQRTARRVDEGVEGTLQKDAIQPAS